jgi:hypothetical protein
MSSYFIGDKTINNIITGLTSKDWTECIMWGYPFKDIIKEEEDFNKFGKELLKLNLSALTQRYKDNRRGNKEILNNYKFEFVNSSKIQFIKNLQCFIYQCCEGNNQKKKLFKDLQKVETALINSYLSELEEYKTAKWGF